MAASARGGRTEALLDTLATPGPQKMVLSDGTVEGSAMMRLLSEALRDVRLATLTFKTLTQDFEIKDRRLTNHLTRLEGDFILEMRGWTAFDGTMEHRILFLGPMAEGDSQQARIVRLLNESGGIRVHGTVSDPKVDLDYGKLAAKLAEEELKKNRGQIEDKVKDAAWDALKDLFKKKKR